MKKSLSLILILILAAILRFYNLGQESFWHDEVFTAMLAKGSVLEIIQRVLGAAKGEDKRFLFQHLSHIFISFMYTFGSSQFLLLLPGAILATLSVGLEYLLGRLLFNTNVGLLAAFLLAISPFHIYYSQELTYYSYFVFFSLLTYLAFGFLLIRPSWRRFFLFLTLSLFNLLTHLTAYFIFASQMLFIGFLGSVRNRRFFSRKTPILILFLGLLVFFSLGFVFSPIRDFFKIWFRPAGQIQYFNWGWPFLVGIVSYFTTTNQIILWLYVFFFLLGLWPFSKNSFFLAYCWVILFVPFVLLALGRVNFYFFHPRHIIFLLPIFFLLVSVGVWRFFNLFKIPIAKNFLLTGMMVIFLLGSVPEIQYFYQTRLTRVFFPGKGVETQGIIDNFRGLGKYLEENEKEKELIIVDQNMNTSGIAFYYRGKNHFTTYNFEKKPLFTKRLGTVGYGWFICHWDCPMEEIVKNDSPALTYVLKKKIISDFSVYQIIPVKNLVFVADMKEYVENKNWQIMADNHYLFDEFLKIDGYFPWQGKTLKLYRIYTDTGQAEISYEVEIPQSGVYILYINVAWNSSIENLSLKIDNRKLPIRWKKIIRREQQKTVDYTGGEIYLPAGKQRIKLINFANGFPLAIHYFFLAPKIN